MMKTYTTTLSLQHTFLSFRQGSANKAVCIIRQKSIDEISKFLNVNCCLVFIYEFHIAISSLSDFFPNKIWRCDFNENSSFRLFSWEKGSFSKRFSSRRLPLSVTVQLGDLISIKRLNKRQEKSCSRKGKSWFN